ncbi:MAG: DUF4147 domain-containing protein [Parcubacteria group bacterium]
MINDPKDWIINRKKIATSKERSAVLDILCAGYDALDTANVIRDNVILDGSTLFIMGQYFDLDDFKNLYVIGIGKASCTAALALERILGSRIKDGFIIDKQINGACKYLTTFKGTHPRPSQDNVNAAGHIVELASKIKKDDLVITIVSGGGSALLCWPQSECDQGTKLYDASLMTEWTIHELNTVRKHTSQLKGGGLAKLLFPASIIGLIFCDIPGDVFEDVASGPTYKDESTVKDAFELLREHDLEEEFVLTETPKNNKYFKKVTNIPLISNKQALRAMAAKAWEFKFKPYIFRRPLYDFADTAIKKLLKHAKPNTVIVGGGEIKMKGKPDKDARGGRNQFFTLAALDHIRKNQTFISCASDGIDNSDAAGAIIDKKTLAKIKKLKLSTDKYRESWDTYPFFEKIGDLIFTGATGTNVADLQILLTK